MAWTKLREVEANSNAYSRYQGPEGAATVFRNGRTLFGFIVSPGGAERAWGPIDGPPEGNVQQVRIFPEGDHWTVYAITDTNDQHRAEWGEAVAPLSA